MSAENYRFFNINNAGVKTRLDIPDSEIENVHLPIVRGLLEKRDHLQAGRERFIVLLAGPPGVGKSTLAAVWGVLSHGENPGVPFQALSADGFFYPSSRLKEQNLVKGEPLSLDLPELAEKMASLRNGLPLRWPTYDRVIHDPHPDGIEVIKSGIVVVEGIYLLLDQPGWRDLRSYADYSIFIESGIEDVRDRVIARYQKTHHLSWKDAASLYESSDGPHHVMIMNERLPANLVLKMAKKHILSSSILTAA